MIDIETPHSPNSDENILQPTNYYSSVLSKHLVRVYHF